MLDLNGVLIGLPVHATLSNARQACVYPVNYRPQTGILALAGFAIRRMRSRPRTPPPIASSLARRALYCAKCAKRSERKRRPYLIGLRPRPVVAGIRHPIKIALFACLPPEKYRA
jgi:hypothetical protein